MNETEYNIAIQQAIQNKWIPTVEALKSELLRILPVAEYLETVKRLGLEPSVYPQHITRLDTTR